MPPPSIAIPTIPSTMEEIDPPYRPYIRAKQPNLATTKPSISRAVPPTILERLRMTQSSIGMLEGQWACLLFRRGLLDGQGFTRREYDVRTVTGGVPQALGASHDWLPRHWLVRRAQLALRTVLSRDGLTATFGHGLVFTNLLLRASRQATSVL
jgi:hypothetical protein